jgi:hypothetical protein
VRGFPLKSILISVLLLSNAAGSGKGDFPVARALAQKPDREQLMNAARAGGDYLVRMQKPNGSFHYYYNAGTDRFESRRYNIVRHAGTTLSLLDLYAATRDARYIRSARRAILFLKTRFRPARQANAAYVLDYDGKAKLGASGLSLAAVARQIELDRRFADRRSANRLANLILAMQRHDGSFEMRYRDRSSDTQAFQSLYYPGEALLGLIRLFKLNGDRRLLEAAQRGAQFLIKSQQQMDALPADAWLMQALGDLYLADPQKQFAGHAIALADAMIAGQYDKDSSYAGGFGPGPPRATPAASRAEGLVSAYRLARSIGDARASRIASALRACAAFQLSQQFTGENSRALPNPARARGGFREGPASNAVRIDFVQHNIASLLGIAEILH